MYYIASVVTVCLNVYMYIQWQVMVELI